MKRRDFIKDTSVSALAVGTASHTFEPETFAKDLMEGVSSFPYRCKWKLAPSR